MRVLGVIPARGGSKGVPNKNTRDLCGQPLIGYTIKAANESRLDRAVVSTDSPELAELARAAGGDVPFLRPPELATDEARPVFAMLHALDALSEAGDPDYDAVMMLQPTTPMRTAADINEALDILRDTGADSVISVVDVGASHPARMKYIEEGRLIDPPFCEAHENQRRQELRPMYIRNGAVYLTRTSVLRQHSFKGDDCRALVMPESRSVNIDTLGDFAHAERVLSGALE